MNANHTAPNPFADAPELALRLAGILLAVAALVAARFLKNPRLVMLIVPLWKKLKRAATRLERGVWPQHRARKARTGQRGGPATAIRLPSGRGWLVRELGWEAAGYGSQLQHVLDDPAMRALVAAAPAVGKLLRPFAQMLGATIAVAAVTPEPEAAREKVAYFPDEGGVGAGAVGVPRGLCSNSG